MQNYFLKKNVLVPYLGIVVALCFLGISFASAEEDTSPVEVLAPESIPTENLVTDPPVSESMVSSTESVLEVIVETVPVAEEISHEEAVPLVVSPAPVYYNLPRVIGTGPTGVPKPLASLTMPRLIPPSLEQGVLGEKITVIDALIQETKRGQKSQKVVDLQNELKALGFFPKTVVSSGLYGPVTDAAVKKYLAEKIVDIDEFIGKVHLGEKSDAVKQLQNALKAHGEFSKAIPSTGWYGPVTEAAVKKYLASLNTPVAPVTPAPEVPSTDEIVGALHFGMRGPQVVELQNTLKKLGFFPEYIPSTGYFGPITRAAVAKYLASR